MRFFNIFHTLFNRIKNIQNKRDKIIIGILWKVFVVLSIPLILNYLNIYPYTDNNTQETQTTPMEIGVDDHKEPPAFLATFANLHEITTLEDIRAHLFYVDSSAYVYLDDFPLELLSALDLTLPLQGAVPRVLITHTHSQEAFIDSEYGNIDHSIIGIGRYLANILSTQYGISVVHDIGFYDIVDGERKIMGSYERMEEGVMRILQMHPEIEVIIDLHRDAAPEHRTLSMDLDGTPTAQLMFFNGITRLSTDGSPKELYELFNPYITENLALSLQMFLTTNEHYPGLARRNYIRGYRYSLHMKPRSLLVEVGGHTSTVEEARNAMYPLARVLVEVLGG